jgi:excisionase family DNA binding protein
MPQHLASPERQLPPQTTPLRSPVPGMSTLPNQHVTRRPRSQRPVPRGPEKVAHTLSRTPASVAVSRAQRGANSPVDAAPRDRGSRRVQTATQQGGAEIDYAHGPSGFNIASGQLLLTIDDAAHCLAISRAHMYRLVQRGEVTAVRLGRSRRVSCVALQDYVERLTYQQMEGTA